MLVTLGCKLVTVWQNLSSGQKGLRDIHFQFLVLLTTTLLSIPFFISGVTSWGGGHPHESDGDARRLA